MDPYLQGVQGERGPLVTFLSRYSDIELTVAQLRLILSLREDREWLGVTDPSHLRPAVWDGDADGFAAALGETPEERETALERSIDRIERSGSSFSRDALSAILAIFEAVGPFPRLAARLHRNAVAILIDGGDATRRLVTPGLADYLFAPESPDRRRAELAASMVDSLGAASAEGAARQWAYFAPSNVPLRS